MSFGKAKQSVMGSLRLDSMGPDSVFVDGNSEDSETFHINHCNIHPGKVLDLYCKTCNQPACSDCVVGRHKDCNRNLCSLNDALEERRRKVTKHKETMLKALKMISEARNEMLSNAGMRQDVYATIKQEVLKCEADAIQAIKNGTRNILNSLERVCSQDHKSMESILFYVATIVDGSMNMLNATDSLLQLSENIHKPHLGQISTAEQPYDYAERSPRENTHHLQEYSARRNMSPTFYNNLTNHGVAASTPFEYNSIDEDHQTCVHFQISDDDMVIENAKDVKVHFQEHQKRQNTEPVDIKHDLAEQDIKKPIPTKFTLLPSLVVPGHPGKQERRFVKSDSSVKTCPINDPGHHDRPSAFQTVKPVIMTGENSKTVDTHRLHVTKSESRSYVTATLDKTSDRSEHDVHFRKGSTKIDFRHSPSDIMCKMQTQYAKREISAKGLSESGHVTTKKIFRLTPQLFSERIKFKTDSDAIAIKTEIYSKPILIKTLQLPLENKSFHSGQDSKVLNGSQRLSSTDSTKLVGMLKRPQGEVTFQPHQLDIAVVRPEESIVVADGWNSCLIAFAKDGDHYYPSVMDLSFDPSCLAEVGNNTVAVTGGTDIIFIKVKPDLVVEKTLYFQKYYQGITHIAPSKIAVSYTPNGIMERYAHIDILSLEGDLLQTISTEIDPDVYHTRLCCNHNEDLVLACCSFGGTVAFLQKSSNYACKFEIDLTKPWSVAFDQNAHIYIVDGDMDHRKLVRTREDGSQPEVILSPENGSTIPASVVFGQDGLMYITQCDGNIKIFHMED